MYQPAVQNKANKYFINEINNASKAELVLKVYDFAITNCKKGDFIKTNEAVGILISSLRFDTPEMKKISVDLLRLYQFVQDQMRKGENEVALTILTDLKTTWLEVFNKKEK